MKLICCKINNYKSMSNEKNIIYLNDFTHNRLVKIDRLFDENKKDFSLMEVDKREVILFNRVK